MFLRKLTDFVRLCIYCACGRISQMREHNTEPITGKGTSGNFFGFFEFNRSRKENLGSNQAFTLTPTTSNALDVSIHHMAPDENKPHSTTTEILADTTCVILEVFLHICV